MTVYHSKPLVDRFLKIIIVSAEPPKFCKFQGQLIREGDVGTSTTVYDGLQVNCVCINPPEPACVILLEDANVKVLPGANLLLYIYLLVSISS